MSSSDTEMSHSLMDDNIITVLTTGLERLSYRSPCVVEDKTDHREVGAAKVRVSPRVSCGVIVRAFGRFESPLPLLTDVVLLLRLPRLLDEARGENSGSVDNADET